jgi:hypothetical protein
MILHGCMDTIRLVILDIVICFFLRLPIFLSSYLPSFGPPAKAFD